MIILGIGGILHDAACAILRDGKLVAAIEEIKIARQHRPGELPDHAIAACLRIAGVTAEQVDCVALVRPFPVDSNIHLETRSRFTNSRLVVVEHHTAHAASAYFASPFDDAVVLTLDRNGDFRCGARWTGRGNELDLDRELYFPDSVGDLYSRVTGLLGFEPDADEHKVQWLSASGDDRFVPVFDELFEWRNGWPRLQGSYFDRDRGSAGFSAKFLGALGLASGEIIRADLQPHVAAGLQRSIEKAVARMAGDAPRLCLAGGVALNALLVASLERSREVFVQPASGNAGTALGAVLHAWHSVFGETGRVSLGNLCWGPEFSPEQIKTDLENCKLRMQYLLTVDTMVETAVRLLQENRIVAWMHGRMEFGPRALGNRSILASPLDPYSTENLNIYIKKREPFRKFAASVPAESANEYFETGPNSRFLATVGRVRSEHKATFAAATLGSDTIRVHKVFEEDNPLYYKLLREWGKATGLPVLYNTSFNLFNDPLVCSPRDAARSFYSSGIDAMFVGRFFLAK